MKNVRIFFEKTGRMKFVSHLDMTRVMSRLIKKSGIPVWYTEGFNKHIYMNFALPLSLGFESYCEIMDIRLNDEGYPNKRVSEKLKEVCPEGIYITEVADPVKHTKEIGFAEYTIDIDGLSNEVAKKLTEFLARDSILCEKKGKKGKVKEIDLIPKIKKSELLENKLNLTVTAGSDDNLNPTLILDTFFTQCDITPFFYTVSRHNILDKQGVKFN